MVAHIWTNNPLTNNTPIPSSKPLPLPYPLSSHKNPSLNPSITQSPTQPSSSLVSLQNSVAIVRIVSALREFYGRWEGSSLAAEHHCS
ncbi:hypothetical protein PIB30_111949, partial [Stylosanthes scabra]|nr:hypothetical protein [Stylosanthes scabra]